MVLHDTGSLHIFKYLVDSLSLAIRLQVIGRIVDHMGSEGCVQLLPKASDKLRTSVGDYCLLNFLVGVDGYEVGRFGESVHDHPNRIKLVGHHG
jgi:hypothetical protein